MSFAGLAFLFFFLPIVLVGYYCFPRRCRIVFLLAANLVFYGWGEPWFLPVILLTAVANWLIGRRITACAEAGTRRLWLIAALVLDLGLLIVFKYTGFLLDTMGLGQVLAKPLPLPLGISFYTFQVISYVVDVYRKTAPAEKSVVSFATYMTFFPQLIAGPIVRYEELRGQLAAREETWNKIANGFCLLMIGLGKKMLLANPMGQLWEGLRALPDGIGLLGAWMGAAAFTMQIYFDFSGYSDMARGLGSMFGFEIPVNFRYPYAAQSIKEFWRRWHITLSQWFRDYVYIPLGGSRCGTTRTFVNLFIVWVLTGLWLTPPDEIELWTDLDLQAVTSVHDGNRREPIVQQGMLFREYLSEADKYPVFLSGNHARIHIETNADSDKRLLVVKDSYAHALAPFLAEEYRTIDLIDLRYFKRQTVSDWMQEHPVDEVLFVYGLSSLAEDKNLQWLA